MRTSRRLCLAFVSSLAVALLAPGAHARPSAKAPTSSAAAMKILDQMISTYKHARTYQEECSLAIVSKMPGTLIRNDLHVKIAFRAPNMLLFESAPGLESTIIASDGKTAYAYTFLQAVKSPAPRDGRAFLAGVVHHGGLSLAFPVFPDPADTVAIAAGRFDMSKVEAVRLGFNRSDAWLRSLSRPSGSAALTVRMKDGSEEVLWIDRQTHLLRQAASDSSLFSVAAKMAAKRGAQHRVPGSFNSMTGPLSSITGRLSDMAGRMLFIVHTAAINKPIPSSVFAFTPPKGAEVATVKSADKLMAGLFGEPSEPKEAKRTSLAGKKPIDFTAVDMAGNPVALSLFKGKPIVVEFCISLDPDCRAELSVLEQAYNKFHAHGLEIVAVSLGAPSVDALKKLVAHNKLTFPVLRLDAATSEWDHVTHEYDIDFDTLPRTLYIAPDWTIKADTTGLHKKSEIFKSIASLGIKTE